MSLFFASSAGGEATLWDPALLGILVFVCAIVLFIGSVYLLLSTNVGAVLGFLIAGAGLSGMMVLMALLWSTTAYPLNTLRGTLPEWRAIAVTAEPDESIGVPALEDAASTGTDLFAEDPAAFANIKAIADAELVIPEAEAGETPEPNEFQEVGGFSSAEDLIVSNIYAVTEQHSWPRTDTRYALIEFCPAESGEPALGDDPAVCQSDVRQLAVQFDYGSLRVPPLLTLFGSIVAFALFSLALNWYERDEREEEQAALPVPAGAS